jgi:hypothetical protein
VAHRASAFVQNRYGADIQLQKLRYYFPNRIVISELLINDPEGDSLIYTQTLDARITTFVQSHLVIQDARLTQPRFYLLKKPGHSELNINEFAALFKPTDSTRENKGFYLDINSARLINGLFIYKDQNCPECFDIDYRSINAEIANFDLDRQYFRTDLHQLALQQRDGFDILAMKTSYAYLENRMEVLDLRARTNESDINGTVIMHYDSTAQLSDFVDLIDLEVDLQSSLVATSEIAYFAPELPDLGRIRVEGRATGPVNNLVNQDLRVAMATGTDLKFGQLQLKNTTDLNNIYFDAEGMMAVSNAEDMKFIGGKFTDAEPPYILNSLGATIIKGDFKGKVDDFYTNIDMQSELGVVKADLNLSLPHGRKSYIYDGRIMTERFDLGKVVSEELLGRVSVDLQVKGEGIDPASMNTRLKGSVSRFDFYGYPYRGISLNGQIENTRFEGELTIADPNLELAFEGSASFIEDTSFYDFDARIDLADLYALGFDSDTISGLTAEMDIDLRALNYNRWDGDIKLFNLTYENSNNFHFFQDIDINSKGLVGDRSLRVNSNIATAYLQGDYSLEGILDAVSSHLSKYIKTRDIVAAPEREDFEFDVELNNAKVLTELFFPDFSVEPGTEFHGSYKSSENRFNIDLYSPEFRYKENYISELKLEYLGDDNKSELEFWVNRYILPNNMVFDSITLSNAFLDDTLNYRLDWILRDDIDGPGHIEGYALQEDSVTFKFGIEPSQFNIGDQNFIILGDNQITVDTAGIAIDNFVINNEGRTLNVNGNISKSPYEVLRISFNSVSLDLVNYLIGAEEAQFAGDIEGNIILSEILKAPKFAANMGIDSLVMNEVHLGELSLSSDWSIENDTIEITTGLRKGDIQTMLAEGYYQLQSQGGIDFDLNFNRFRLAAFDPFLEGLAERLRGGVTGQVKVTGTTGRPFMSGEVMLPKTAFTLSFLQTDYNLVGNPRVEIRNDGFYFPEVEVRDTRYGTQGVLSGAITHKNYRKFYFDFKIEADELLVLNTTSQTRDPYYGRAFVSGDMLIRGPIDDIVISGNLASRRNSEFFIQMDAQTEVRQTDFVKFVNPYAADTVDIAEIRRLNLDKGVSLDFNLAIDQSAVVGIVIDDIYQNNMQGTGEGNIRVKVDQYSDIEIYGQYVINQGVYNFEFQDALRRRFDILRGGSITWNGDPYGAIIDLDARYSIKADPEPILPQYSAGRTLIWVDLLLTGDLMNPDINFDVLAPRATSSVQQALNTQLSDQNDRYQQVFALLTIGNFIGDNGVENAGDIWNTTEMGLNVLASTAENYLNQFTGDLNLTLGYQGPGTDAGSLDPSQEEVEVGGSIDILNDRITLNGVVGVPVGANTQSQFTGDFEVEYDITRDGRFRAKVFNRPVQQYSLGQQYYQQGIGVFYQHDFEYFFGKKKSKKKEEKDLESRKDDEAVKEE